MDEHQKTFLEELQSLEESTKRKILIVATIIIMIVIIYFWLAYFNGIVSGANQTAIVAQSQPVVTGSSAGPGFFWNVMNGAAKVYQGIQGGIQWLGSSFEESRQYVVQGK